MVDSIPADNTCQSESPPAGRPVCTLQRPRQSKSDAVCTLQRPPQSKSDVVCTLQRPPQSKSDAVCTLQRPRQSKRDVVCTLQRPHLSKRDVVCTLQRPHLSKRDVVCTLQRPRQNKSDAVCTLQRPPQSKSDVVCTLQSLRQSRRLSVVGYNGGKNAKSPCAVSVIDTTHGLLYILFTSLPLNISCLPPPHLHFAAHGFRQSRKKQHQGAQKRCIRRTGHFRYRH